MKILFLTILAAFTLICSCQSKTTKVEPAPTEKSCCADTTKSCCAKGETKACCAHADSISMPGVQVIYFHNERRCATCMAIEEGAVEVVKQIADSSVTFNSYLFGDPKNVEIEKKYNVDGQTLLIIGKGKVINFTEQAFLNARVKPDAYKEELKAEIEKLK
jgi:hypothetical protein